MSYPVRFGQTTNRLFFRQVARLMLSLAFACTAGMIAPRSLFAQTIQFEFQRHRLEGKPVAWTSQQMMVMHPDGQMGIYPIGEMEKPKVISENFSAIDHAELKARLHREFGGEYQAITTAHFIVLCQGEEGVKWGDRFESIYRGLVTFAARRGFAPEEPVAPLIALIFPDERTFLAYAKRTRCNLPPQTAGYYSSLTNRIALYDPRGRFNQPALEEALDATITHEAAHQVAYNIGLHVRLTDTPVWIAEGFATLCENPAIWDTSSHASEPEKVNFYQRQQFINLIIKRQMHGWLHALIANRDLFDRDTEVAYAAAWATMFYLAERDAKGFSSLMRATASIEPFSSRSADDWLEIFKDATSDNIRLIEARIEELIAEEMN